MKLLNATRLAYVLATVAIGVGACVVACGSSSSNGYGGDGGGANGEGGGGGACANPTVPIVFSPMYSAFIPNSTVGQTFAVPAITADGNQATWTASDPSMVNLAAQSFTVDGVSQPGVMITMNGTGDSQGHVSIYATESDGSCGVAVLTITTNSDTDWQNGTARYNDGNNLHLQTPDGGGHRPDGGFPEGGFPHGDGGGGGGGFSPDAGSPFETDGGTACTTCHGPTATEFIFKDVEHTPEQTGGFSDQDLTNIILNGQVPDGGYFDPAVLDGFAHQTCDDAGTTVGPNMSPCAQKAYTAWSGLHQWADITSDEMPGVICYLRSLAPQDQSGTSSFGGGGGHHDGGKGGGGGGGTEAGGGGTDAGGGG